jgi:hypothetical protein
MTMKTGMMKTTMPTTVLAKMVPERAYDVRKGAAYVRDISWCQRYCGGLIELMMV